MKLDSIAVPRLLVLLLSCAMALAACSTGGSAKNEQRYFTWVDEFGRVRQSPINEQENPVKQRAAQLKAEQKAPAAPGEKQVEVTGASAPAPDSPKGHAENLHSSSQPFSTEEIQTSVTASAELTKVASSQNVPGRVPGHAAPGLQTRGDIHPDVVIKVANDESASQAKNAPPQTQIDPDLAAASKVKGPHQPEKTFSESAPGRAQEDESEYTLENYPDGNELAEKGFIREGDPLPYFTWRDAQGNLRVDYYQPEAGFDRPDQSRGAPALTPALVIDGSRQPMVEQANSDALALLGIDKTETLLDAWAGQCCEDLPRKDMAKWDDSREFQLDLDGLAPEFRFSTGTSVYRLVNLPEPGESAAFVMQVRSYVRHGVFLPTFVFLDKNMETRRLVTELAFEYQPESWHSHGYLEAQVPVFPRQGDRWLLIMSRAEDQAGQTVFETSEGTTVIRHSRHGLLGLAQMGN